MSEKINYVSLHNHSSFSIMDSLIDIKPLFKRVKELGQPAVAITDHGTLAGLWDALKTSRDTGVKLIAGCEFYFVDDVEKKDAKIRHVILLAKNAKGYENLLRTSAEGYDNYIVAYKKAIPRIDWNILEKYAEGQICLTACSNGILGQLINEKKFDEATKQAQRLKDIFGDNLGLEVQPHYLKRKVSGYSGQIDQVLTNKKIKEIGKKLGIRCVATTDAHYLTPGQSEAHEVLLAMASGNPFNSSSRLTYNVPDFYLKTGEEVYDKLSRQLGDEFAKECIANSLYFADMCEFPNWIEPKYSNPSGKELPDFPVKDQYDYQDFLIWLNNNSQYSTLEEDKQYLRYKCELAFTSYNNEKEYRDRLEEEMDVFYHCGVSSYILIVYDLIEWAKKNGITVGPGRGSVGGSFIAYLLGIHQADPVKYGLVFSRFHNKLKQDYSDIDMDFSKRNRHKVIEYIISKYGQDNVAAISNYNTITPKVYARSIARTFMYGGDRKSAVKVGTALADAIPSDLKTVKDALEKATLFATYAKPVENDGGGYIELKKYADCIGSKITATSTHAAGIIINRRPLRGLVPLRRDKEGNISIEYEKDRAEANGLVKMDILGLATLDIMDDTYKFAKANGKDLDQFNYHTYDEDTYKLISSGKTFCVFQFGTSAGTIDLCKRYQPKNMEDLAIITTLARPAAKEIRNDFFLVKNGEKEFKLLHPSLERAFKSTYGFALFDEQLLVLANDVSSWDYNKGDVLRKITKAKGKNPEKAIKAKQDFISDAMKNNIKETDANEIWDKVVDPFTKYSFNKSHAVLYSCISYKSAYYKRYAFLEFAIANIIFETHSNAKISADNISRIKEEIRSSGVKIIPPNINDSDITYRIIDANTVMTGLDSLKYIGKEAIPEILAKRPFISFDDFLTRTDGRKVKAPAIQALAAAGCLDSFGMSRKLMYLYSADYRKKYQAYCKRKNNKELFVYPWPEEGDWTIAEKCALEKYYLGEVLSGDKVQEFNGFFTYGAINFKTLPKLLPPLPPDLSEYDRRKHSRRVSLIQGEIKSIFEFKVKKEGSKLQGEVMAKITLEDPFGNQIGLTCFPDGWIKMQDKCLQLTKNKCRIAVGVGLYLNGSLNWYENELSIIFDELVRVSPPPSLPNDLKAKKISMRTPKSKKEEVSIEEVDRNILLEEMEDELAESGNLELDGEDYE